MNQPLILNSSGFPMLYLSSIQAYLGCLPVTKIEFEYFLMSTINSRYNRKMYQSVLDQSRRLSPQEITSENYMWSAATGITPREARDFAQWISGSGNRDICRLPSKEEWLTAWDELKDMSGTSVLRMVRDHGLPISERVEVLLEQLGLAIRDASPDASTTMLDEMMMRNGVFEWILKPDDRWGAAGEPHEVFSPGIRNGGQDISEPRDVESRMPAYGFRLLLRN